MQPAYRTFKDGKSPFKIQEEDPDIVHHFIELNKKMPSVYQITGTFIYEEWLKYFEINHKDNYIISWKMEMDDYCQVVIQVRVNKSVIFVRSGRTMYGMPELYDIPEDKADYIQKRGLLSFTSFDILYDPEHGLPADFIKAITKLKLTDNDNDNVNKIHLICQDPDIGLYTKELPIQGDDYEGDLALHYGDEMRDFHDKLIKRLTIGTKGIILFYGDPGTGKSFYIKRLCKDLFKVNKKILYLPNNMVDNLGTPQFNNFLLDWADVSLEDGKKKGVLIIIEDGERVLLKRDNNPHGADGVSNILNSTDGILNDFLNIQILATFNTEIENIDEAILRKKRALAMKEFKKLSTEDAQRLADHLKIEVKVAEPMTLADIYSLLDEEEDNVLFKDNKRRKKMGFVK